MNKYKQAKELSLALHRKLVLKPQCEAHRRVCAVGGVANLGQVAGTGGMRACGVGLDAHG